MKRLLTPLRHAAKSMAEITRVWYQIPLSPSGRLSINLCKKKKKRHFLHLSIKNSPTRLQKPRLRQRRQTPGTIQAEHRREQISAETRWDG